jgi:hypothetical protein
MIITIACSILSFALGWWLCSKVAQGYIRNEIMHNKTPFDGKELEALKKFAGYKEPTK